MTGLRYGPEATGTAVTGTAVPGVGTIGSLGRMSSSAVLAGTYAVGVGEEAMSDVIDAAAGGRVVVVGSVNVDTVLFVDRLSTPGETQLARQVEEHIGGKGLSQAIAAASFGSDTALIGTVGDDDDGMRVRVALAAAGVDDSLLRVVPGSTGHAYVTVDRLAENSIVVVSGVNAELEALSDDDREAIAAADVLVTQFEAGEAVALDALRIASSAGVTTILNAAPATELPDLDAVVVDLLIVNQVEAVQLAGADDLDSAIDRLAARFGAVLVTMGERGGRLFRDGGSVDIATASVEAVDTTGAGDVSCGVIAAALAQGRTLDDAVTLAFAASALAVQRRGNVASIPARDEVLTFAALPLA